MERDDRRRSLEREREYLALSMRSAEGDPDVEFPRDVESRAVVDASPPNAAAALTSPAATDVHMIFGGFAPFGKALIDNPVEGRFVEMIRLGSLRRTISERAGRVLLRLNHGSIC